MELCKHTEDCGGCLYQGVPYTEQLDIKQNEVERLLAEKGIEYDELMPIEQAPSQYRYRNKMEYTFGDLVKDGELTLGMHKRRHFMSIVTVDQCQLVHEDFNRILSAVLQFSRERNYQFYHKRSHEGLLRHLIIRRGEQTGELLVNIVTSSEEGFDELAFVQCIQSIQLENTLVGILRTMNDNIADAVNCEELRVLWGRDYYMETIMCLNFKVSAFSFFQTNTRAAERLYAYGLSLIDSQAGKTIFDLFCGTGTITQALAQVAAKVIGVELVEEAVESAKSNALLNQLDNCAFIAGDVFKVMDQITEKPDLIVVDPPRVGIMDKALDKIIAYDVDQILYISCNPKTLAINLARMQEQGYRTRSIKPFDNFANTKHIECVCLVTRKNEKQVV